MTDYEVVSRLGKVFGRKEYNLNRVLKRRKFGRGTKEGEVRLGVGRFVYVEGIVEIFLE